MWINVKVVPLNWDITNMFSLFQICFISFHSRKQFCSNVCRCMQGITCPLPLCCLLHRVQHHRNFYFIQYVLYKMWRCMFCMNLTKGKSNKFPNSWSRINRHTLQNVYWAVNVPFVCSTKVFYFIYLHSCEGSFGADCVIRLSYSCCRIFFMKIGNVDITRLIIS